MPENQKRESIGAAFYPLAGLVLIWAIFLPRIFTGESALAGLLEHDIGFQWVPFKEYARWGLALGYFPLWCPYVFAGMPFLAFTHTGVLYPLGWMLTFFNYAKAVNCFYPIHLSIGFLGLYLLAQNLGISRFSSFLAALSAIFSAKFLYLIHFLPVASSNFWGIWFFYFLVKMAKKRTVWPVLGMSAVLCLEFLGGDVESTAYQLCSAPFFLLIVLREQKNILSAVWIVSAISILLGIFLALAQLLPMTEYSSFFLRSAGFTLSAFEARSLPIQLGWAMLFPIRNLHLPGIPPDAPLFYLGLISIFFPLLAILLERKYVWLFLLAMGFAFFSSGSVRPLDWVVFHIPLLNRFGAQEHSFFLSQIFLALLAGFGIDLAINKRRMGILFFLVFSLAMIAAGRIWFNDPVRPALAIFSVLSLLFFFWMSIAKKPQSTKITLYVILFLAFALDLYSLALFAFPGSKPDRIDLLHAWQELQKAAGQSGARSVEVSRLGMNDSALLTHLGLRTHVGTIDGWITVPPLSYARLLNLVNPRSVEFKDGKVNKFAFNVDFRDGKFIGSQTMPLLDLLSLKYILDNGENFKFASPFSLARYSAKNLEFAEGRGEIPYFEANDGFNLSGIELRTYDLYLESSDALKTGIRVKAASKPAFLSMTFQDRAGTHLIYSRAIDNRAPREISIPLANFAGASGPLKIFTAKIMDSAFSAALADPRIENPTKPIQRIHKNGMEIYLNQEAFPEAFMVHSCRWITDDDKLLEHMKNMTQWDLSREIILSRETPSARLVKSTEEELRAKYVDLNRLKEPVEKIADEPDRLVFKTYLLKPGYLFLNHQYLPGWKVWVDNREWQIERADYCFRAVFLDQGAHTVEFRYEPAGFEIGVYFSLASCLSFVILAGTIFCSRFLINNKQTPTD